MHEQRRGSGIANERATDDADAFPPPALGEPGNDQRRGLDRGKERLRRPVSEDGLCADPDDPLDGQRSIGEETACVPLVAARISRGADKTKRKISR